MAANGVILAHLASLERKYLAGPPILDGAVHYGLAGVDLFFVISGFIMVSCARSLDWRCFLLRRVTRIYPPYWIYTTLVLLVWYFVPGIVNSSYHHPPSLWRSYLLFPDDVGPLLAVGWTLVHEMYFYLVFAALLGLGLVGPIPFLGWALVVFLGNLALHAPFSPAPMPIAQLLVHPLTLEFILGAGCAFVRLSDVAHRAVPALVLGIVLISGSIALLGYPGAPIDIEGDWARVICFGVPAVLIVYGATAAESLRKLSEIRWLVLLGNASYSTYLSHLLVLSALGRLVGRVPTALSAGITGHLAFVLGALAIANGVGLLGYAALEKPILRWSRTREMRRAGSSLSAVGVP